METITNYGLESVTIYKYTWLLLIIFMAFMTTKIIVSTIRTERRRKSFSPNMKPGDQVRVPVMNDQYSGEVLEVNGDEVKIIVTAPKNRVYPKSN